LSDDELTGRLRALDDLAAGKLIPPPHAQGLRAVDLIDKHISTINIHLDEKRYSDYRYSII
jgi:hypothetical protein